MELWLKVGIILVSTYVVISIIAYFIQDILLFHPEILSSDFRFNYEEPFEEVFIDIDEHTRINGLYFAAETSDIIVFYFKGNTRSIKGWAKFATDFIPKQVDFFMIDYPGFGKSIGRRTEKDIDNDGQIVYQWLKNRYPDKKIVIYGRSLGAGFASFVAAKENPYLLILDSPYYSFKTLANYYAFFLPLKWILKYELPLHKHVRQMKCKVHIIHGRKDKIIPYAFSAKLARENPDKVVLHTIEEGKHNNLPTFPTYHEVLEKILK